MLEFREGPGFVRCDRRLFGEPARFCLQAPFWDEDDRLPLGARETVEVDVRFTPRVAGVEGTGSFTFSSCPGDVCDLLFSARGVGIARGFSCDPPVVDFRAVSPGACAQRTVTCENVANETITVTSWGLGPVDGVAPSEDFSVPIPRTQVLGPNDAMSLDVDYCPPVGDTGSDAATLEVFTDSPRPDARVVRVPVEGSGGGPDICVLPDILNFGLVSLIAPDRRSIVVRNCGFQPLLISEIQLDTQATQTLSSPDAAPTTLEPGATYTFTVEAQPVVEGPVTTSVRILSNDQDEPELDVPVFVEGVNLPPCAFSVSPRDVNFGTVSVNRTSTRVVEVRNTGAADCLVTSVRLLPETVPQFSLPDGDVFSEIIPAQSSKVVRVELTPHVAGTYLGAVEFSISSPSSPFNRVEVFGTAGDTTLLVAPSDIDFGALGVDCRTRAFAVNVYNSGASPAIIESIRLAENAGGAFRLSRVPPSGVTLEAGGRAAFDVTFRPDRVSDFGGAVFIDAVVQGKRATYVVSLGSGRDADRRLRAAWPTEGRYHVCHRPQRVDDRGAGLAPGELRGVHSVRRAQALDYQIGVTSTDIDDAGRFFSGARSSLTGPAQNRIVTPLSSPSPEAVFVENAKLRIGGGAPDDESGLEAAYRALTAPTLTGHNAGFLRPDAILSIVWISDEADQSPRGVGFYLSFFQSLKGFRNWGLFTGSAIAAPVPEGRDAGACDGQGGRATGDRRYLEAIDRTGGIFQSICTADWGRALEELSNTVFGLQSRFFLTNSPVISTIRVTVDGDEVPARLPSGTTLWTYNAGRESVDFSPLATPEPGAKIRVEYVAQCR